MTFRSSITPPPFKENLIEEAALARRGYRLVELIGYGSYGKVYMAEYTPPEDPWKVTTMACKVIDTAKLKLKYVNKFLPRELEILRKVQHEHITRVNLIFEKDTKFYIFMRYEEHGNLYDYIEKNGVLVEDQARVWFRHVVLGMIYLHGLNIVHRDLKCENLLISANFNITICDFSFSRFCEDKSGKQVLSTTYCGSLAYASPEILRGKPYNPKMSDVWSMGIILYIMVNKSMPFSNTNIKRFYYLQITRKWKFRSRIEHTLSEDVKNLVRFILEPDVNKRWNTQMIANSEWLKKSVNEDTELISVPSNIDQMSVIEPTNSLSNVKSSTTNLHNAEALTNI